MDKVKFGEKIKALRKESGIARQDDLASKAGVSVRVIKELEGGKGNQTLDNLISVFEVLKVGFGNFLAELDSAPTTAKPAPTTLDVSHIQPDPNLILNKLAEIEQSIEKQKLPLGDLAKSLEDAAKWRAFEAKYKDHDDLLKALMELPFQKVHSVRLAAGLKSRIPPAPQPSPDALSLPKLQTEQLQKKPGSAGPDRKK